MRKLFSIPFISILISYCLVYLTSVCLASDPVDPNSQVEDLRVGNIPSDKREKIKSRVESLSFKTFGFGPAWIPSGSNKKMFYGVNYGYNWDVSEHGEIRAGFFGSAPSEGSGYFVSGGIGGSFFFSTSNISPILGGEFGIGAMKDGDTSYSGFAYEAHGGLRFFRTSNTQLSLEAFYRNIAKTGSPGMSGLSFSILF